MSTVPPNPELSPKEKEVSLRISYDVQNYIGIWLKDNYPDFGKKWSELHRKAVDETEKLIQAIVILKKGYENDYVLRFDNFKKEIDEFLNEEHPIFPKLTALSTEISKLTKNSATTLSEIKAMGSHAEEIIEDMKQKENIIKSMSVKLTSSSSIYEDVYKLREEVAKFSKQIERFTSAFKNVFEEPKEEDLDKPIEELGFSIRTTNCLVNSGIETLKDLLDTPDSHLRKLRNFGNKSLVEIQNFKEKLVK